MSRRITVIGAGVIGLSIAHDFAIRDERVTVITDADTMDTVSAVSAALWFPFKTEKSEFADRLLARSLTRFTELLDVPGAGVSMRDGTMVERHADPDRSWTTALSGARDAPAASLPDGAASGLRVAAPFIDIPRYLPWLREQARAAGATFELRAIHSLGELQDSSDLIVVATGIRGGQLLGGDDSVYPVRGQIVRLENPGVREWIVDEDHPRGITYVFPREHDLLVGGTVDEGDWDLEVRPEVQTAMLERAAELVPALTGSRVLGAAVGLRPARPRIRLEVVDPAELSASVPVIAAYGHGGSGVTLSWGTAEAVLDLAEAIR